MVDVEVTVDRLENLQRKNAAIIFGIEVKKRPTRVSQRDPDLLQARIR